MHAARLVRLGERVVTVLGVVPHGLEERLRVAAPHKGAATCRDDKWPKRISSGIVNYASTHLPTTQHFLRWMCSEIQRALNSGGGCNAL
eukprot:1004962-Pleurochrysis_carterae.AAC.12